MMGHSSRASGSRRSIRRRPLRFQFLEHRNLLSAMAMDAAGRFVVGGTLCDREGGVITHLGSCGQSVAAFLDDGFVGACSITPANERRKDIFLQRFDREGQPRGDLMNLTNSDIDQVQPTVAVDATGHVIVSWMDQVS